MKQILITTILTLLFFGKTLACLNGDSKVLKDGTFLYEDREGSVPYGHDFYKDDFESGIKQLDSLYIATKDIDYLSDKGLLLILLKKYDEAIKLYLEIEKIKPNRYSTASNIGTAYELIGQNENALKWIKKSVELDPESHNNSEWIHVKILEAKIKGEQFYTTNFLLNTDFGSDILPNSQMTKQQLQDLSNALYYQLNERVSFVKPKEKIVAQLLFDIGNIAFLLGNYYDASADYEQAKLYGYAGQLIEQRIEQTKILIKQAEQKREQRKVEAQKQSSYLTYGLLIGGGLVLTFLTIIIYRRKKKNNS
jgi:tetratricopeptide (TPR) repeat protein